MSVDKRASSVGTPLLLEIFSAEGLKNVQFFGDQVSGVAPWFVSAD
jgi:hypothetical protein